MQKLALASTLAYADVDRKEVASLPALLKLLQEGAIQHADLFGMGTRAMSRGESWVLNRLALTVHPYPRYQDKLQLETWSGGVEGFRGYREYRLYNGGHLCLSASSLWLYINIATKSLVRIPPEQAATFPVISTPPFLPGIDRLTWPLPQPAVARTVTVSVRYSDLDANGHVNNTAYADFLQTALVKAGLPCSPRNLQIRFVKEIAAVVGEVTISMESTGERVLFAIAHGSTLFAHGEVS
jgi:acyl-ACP thioesterase